MILNRFKFCPSAVVFALSVWITNPEMAKAEEMLLWRFVNGYSTIEGAFVSKSKEDLTILQESGELKVIPLKALSVPDVLRARMLEGERVSRPEKMSSEEAASEESGRKMSSGSGAGADVPSKEAGNLSEKEVEEANRKAMEKFRKELGEQQAREYAARHPYIEANSDSLTEYGKALQAILVNADGSPVDLMAGREKAPMYYLFYKAGSWCKHCRNLTPEVVKFYEEVKQRKGNVEVVLIPVEEDEKSAFRHLNEFGMKFPMVRFADRYSDDILGKLPRSVPAMRLVDASGKSIFSDEDDHFDILRAARSRSIKPSVD